MTYLKSVNLPDDGNKYYLHYWINKKFYLLNMTRKNHCLIRRCKSCNLFYNPESSKSFMNCPHCHTKHV